MCTSPKSKLLRFNIYIIFYYCQRQYLISKKSEKNKFFQFDRFMHNMFKKIHKPTVSFSFEK